MDIIWGSSAGQFFSRNSLSPAEKQCSLSHKFLQISPNSSKRTGPLSTCAVAFMPYLKHLAAITESSLAGPEEQKMKVNMIYQALLHLENSMKRDYLFSLFFVYLS